MHWVPEYTRTFLESINGLRHKYQRLQVRNELEAILSLPHPKDRGGKYSLNTDMWAYLFGDTSLILCSLDESKMVITFENLLI